MPVLGDLDFRQVQNRDPFRNPNFQRTLNASQRWIANGGGAAYQNNRGPTPLPLGNWREQDLRDGSNAGNRGALRLVGDAATGIWYITTDHYDNFYRVTGFPR